LGEGGIIAEGGGKKGFLSGRRARAGVGGKGGVTKKLCSDNRLRENHKFQARLVGLGNSGKGGRQSSKPRKTIINKGRGLENECRKKEGGETVRTRTQTKIGRKLDLLCSLQKEEKKE